jgi:hypothetical protein
VSDSLRTTVKKASSIFSFFQEIFCATKKPEPFDGSGIRTYDFIAIKLWDAAPPSGLSCRFDIAVRRDFPRNLPEFLLVRLDTVANQHQDMTVDGASLVFHDKAELIQHFLLDTDGYAFYCHLFTSV